MTSTFDPPDMPRLHALDGEFGEDAAAVLRARRRRTSARLLMLAGVVLGLGAIGVLAFAWSNADGGLRFELQSAATPPKNAPRAATEEEIDRLRREIDALKNELKEAAHTIAAVKLAEQELRRQAPAPYWYSNPEALNPAIAREPRSAGVAPLPRRSPAARSDTAVPSARPSAPR